jgi:RNA polymerase sigma factor (sigma-70 family)
MADKDEHDLVNGLKANDPIYQKQLVDRYAERLLHIVMSLGLSSEDSLEVVNDSLYKVVKKINQFDLTRGSKFSAWIVRIAINTARDRYKQIKDPPVSQSTDERAERGIQDVEALWQDQDQTGSELGLLARQILRQALDSLSENDQDILRCFACGMQHKEIAALMNKTPGAVKTGHFRAKERLKQKYINILEFFEDKSTAKAIKNFLDIEAVNEKAQN